MQWWVELGEPQAKSTSSSGMDAGGRSLREWTTAPATNEDIYESSSVRELHRRLSVLLDGGPPAGTAFALELLLSQAREISDLRHARGAEVGVRERNARLEAEVVEYAREAASARRLEREQGELWSEAAAEASLLRSQVDMLGRSGQLRLHRSEARAERVGRMEREDEEIRSEYADYQRKAASEIWSLRLEVNQLKQECMQHSGSYGSRHAPWAAGQPNVDWDDPGAVFDAFASSGQGDDAADSSHGPRRIRAPDFRYLCESLRRAQGRGPTPPAQRQGFGEFAFGAVFGEGVTEVDRARFLQLYRPFAAGLHELEGWHCRSVGGL